jgi:hypothetical protein
MSQDFKKVLVKDNRLMVTDSVKYAVVKGGSNMTCTRFPAIGSGPFTSNINFNIQVPSQETVISRNALIQNQMVFSITGATVASASGASDAQTGLNWLFHYGGLDAFGPFPFHQCVNSTQWTINNNTVSQNTRDILAIICRIHDKRKLARYNGMTPTMYDTYQTYPVTTDVLNNPNGSYQAKSLDNDLEPRGAFYLDSITPTGAANYLPAGTARTLIVTITTTEPILVSPWTFAGDDGQGMYGIQNLNAIYNLDQTANLAIRFGNATARFGAGVLPATSLVRIESSTILFQFVTPHPSDLMPSRNVLPYYELPRYLTQVPVIAAGQIGVVTSQSLQLNQIPDKLFISIGKPAGQRRCSDTDSFLPIQGITINWNNSSGLLSSATRQDLWRMSVENGMNLTWNEFRGIAQASPTVAAGAGATPSVNTAGSVICLEFGKDIELKDDYYAPGSLGNFQLQFNVQVLNNTAADLTIGQYQILTVIQNSGVFSLERGVASSYLGILTKSDVLEASRTQAHSYSDALRMVGGGDVPSFSNRLPSSLGRLAKMDSGAGMSAGGASGGRRKKDMGALEDRLH